MEYSLINDVDNPLYFKNIKSALDRIIRAINEREKIVVYGNHDFDSVCAISLFMLVLKYLNSDVEYFIPNADRDERDLCIEDVEKNILCLGTDLIITVGCGVKSEAEADYCRQNNIEAIVVDYREHISLEKCNTILNTYHSDLKMYGDEFTASSITFRFIEYIASYYKITSINKYLDLVMMGIIASGVNIDGDNRYLVEEGLRQLNNTNNYGIIALMREHNRKFGGELEFYDDGIRMLMPRMISKGHPDNARILVELFTTTDSYRAKQISKYLYSEITRKKE